MILSRRAFLGWLAAIPSLASLATRLEQEPIAEELSGRQIEFDEWVFSFTGEIIGPLLLTHAAMFFPRDPVPPCRWLLRYMPGAFVLHASEQRSHLEYHEFN